MRPHCPKTPVIFSHVPDNCARATDKDVESPDR